LSAVCLLTNDDYCTLTSICSADAVLIQESDARVALARRVAAGLLVLRMTHGQRSWWPEPLAYSERPRRSKLRRALLSLRKALAQSKGVSIAHARYLPLNLSGTEIDVLRFDRSFVMGRRGVAERVAAHTGRCSSCLENMPGRNGKAEARRRSKIAAPTLY